MASGWQDDWNKSLIRYTLMGESETWREGEKDTQTEKQTDRETKGQTDR